MGKCPKCGASVNTSDKRCSRCGASLDKNKNLKLIIGILAVVVVLAIVGAFATGVFNSGETTNVADSSAPQVTSPVNNSTTNDVNTSSQSSSDDDGSSATDTEYWASAKTDKFHDPSCEWAQKISDNNKIVYHSREEAIADGKEPCSVCNP